jgi:hypothetical protein
MICEAGFDFGKCGLSFKVNDLSGKLKTGKPYRPVPSGTGCGYMFYTICSAFFDISPTERLVICPSR